MTAIVNHILLLNYCQTPIITKLQPTISRYRPRLETELIAFDSPRQSRQLEKVFFGGAVTAGRRDHEGKTRGHRPQVHVRDIKFAVAHTTLTPYEKIRDIFLDFCHFPKGALLRSDGSDFVTKVLLSPCSISRQLTTSKIARVQLLYESNYWRLLCAVSSFYVNR